jgi:predicted dehydrogenase
MKTVAGVPLRRPAWFLNIDECGEGLADVGTHVIDLVQWVAFPGQQIDYRSDVQVAHARRWPTIVSQSGFAQLTGQAEFPPELKEWVKGGELEYYSNHIVQYKVRGVHVALDIRWLWEAPAGSGDLYESTFRGSRARAEIRQGAKPNSRPELYVLPNTPALSNKVVTALREKVRNWQKEWPGVDLEIRGHEAHIVIPDKYRVGHEAHFAQVTRAFLQYLKNPGSLPAWEQSNMLVKYYISTRGVELSRGRGGE